jgi:hypothetical protein
MGRIYICKIDNDWHPMNIEMPPVSTDVELLKPDGEIVKGEIVVDMAGYYIYLKPGWSSLNYYTHWRFIEGYEYPYYEEEYGR